MGYNRSVSSELCPLCRGQSVPLDSRGRMESWLRCLVCSNVFDPGQRLEAPTGRRSRSTVRRINSKPETMWIQRTPAETVDEHDRYRREAQSRDDIVIRWSGNRQRKMDGLFGTVIWGIGLFTALADPPASLAEISPMMWAVYGVLALSGIFILRHFFANLFNTTTIWVRGHRLSVWSSPFPRRPRREFDVEDINQLWVERVTHRGEQHDQAVVIGYSLFIRARQHERLELVRLLETPQDACWLEQQIEDCLGIVDVAVEGEVAPAA
jgi:hypothetical protein